MRGLSESSCWGIWGWGEVEDGEYEVGGGRGSAGEEVVFLFDPTPPTLPSLEEPSVLMLVFVSHSSVSLGLGESETA